jgi:hypothetical protein
MQRKNKQTQKRRSGPLGRTRTFLEFKNFGPQSINRPMTNQTLWDLRGRNVHPPSVRVELPYVENLVLVPGVAFAENQFNLNSIFDPDRTGVGHQPLGYDQWSGFYSRYRVLGVRAIVHFQNISTDGARVTIAGTNSTTALTTLSAAEQPFSQNKMIGGLNGNSTGWLSYDYSIPRVVGRSMTSYLGSDNNAAVFGSNPAEVAILHLFVYNLTGGVVNVQAEVKLLYDVILYDAVELPDS